MGINAGSRKGGASGQKRANKAARPIQAVQERKPFLPLAENPFPFKDIFRLGMFEVTELINGDYIECKGLDPNAKDPFSNTTPSTPLKRIKVARPPLLQRTPWDGEEVEIEGITYSYEYSSDYERTKSYTDEDGNDQEDSEEINIPYFVGDTIIAAQLQRNAVQDGLIVNEEKSRNQDDGLLTWVDLNVSGRDWVGPSSGCDSQNAKLQLTVFGVPVAGTFSAQFTINDVTELIIFNFDDGADEVKTAMATHSEVSEDDMTVISAGDFPTGTIQIEFIEDLGNQHIPLPLLEWSDLSGGAGLGVIASYSQLGISG